MLVLQIVEKYTNSSIEIHTFNQVCWAKLPLVGGDLFFFKKKLSLPI
jgi:hypothetical protein